MQGVEPEVMEGDWHPDRVVVLEFPSKENAKEFFEGSRCSIVIRNPASIYD